jgi:hypothetical protein
VTVAVSQTARHSLRGPVRASAPLPIEKQCHGVRRRRKTASFKTGISRALFLGIQSIHASHVTTQPSGKNRQDFTPPGHVRSARERSPARQDHKLFRSRILLPSCTSQPATRPRPKGWTSRGDS